MGDRLLVRHFLGRFLEHDLISSNADRREVVSVIGGTVMAISLFLSVIIAFDYQFSNFLPPVWCRCVRSTIGFCSCRPRCW
jgi:hypothetical protein